jgi:DNA-binding helix-hairpin-helix protein with protein kinase domain
MQVQRLSTGQRLTLDRSSTLGAGGEARIYTLPQDAALVAKVYHAPDRTQARKLAVMIAQLPDDPMAAHGHISIAWPIDLLCTTDRHRQVIGFLMPRVTGMRSLITCYNPVARRQQWPLFSYRYLHRTAHNLAAAVRALHARGYVIGDVNESNILVTSTALVTLVDTDSFQVHEPHNGMVYRCLVGKPEYTPPELQGRPFMQVDRMVQHDLFGVAVLMFQLLMEGTHPFAGVYQAVGDPPPYEARIAQGHFPHGTKRHGPYRAMPSAPPFTLLHPTLQEMFVRCFKWGIPSRTGVRRRRHGNAPCKKQNRR